MSATPLPYIQNTPAWEAARRDSIGSSDIPVITGSAPYARSSKVDLWAWMTRRIERLPVDPETQELFDLGHALEPVIAARYTIKKGRKLRRVRHMLRHPEIEWATASLDRVSAVKGEHLVVELKWDPWSRFARAPEAVPAHVQDQVQWQLLVSGYEAADVAVMEGGRVSVLEVAPDPSYQQDLLAIGRDFWERCIVGGEMPKMDGSEATRRALLRLRPSDDGTLMEPTAELHALMHELAETLPRLKEMDERVKTIKNTLRSILGEHAGAEADGWKLTYRHSRDSHRTDWRAVAEAYRALLLSGDEPPAHMTGLELLDAIEAEHTETKEGTRSLLPTWKAATEEGEGSWT